MKLRGKIIDNFQDPLFVADIGQNHDGSIDKAKKLIIEAKEAGCDRERKRTRTNPNGG